MCVLLTPSDEGEAPEVFGVRSEGHEDEAVQVQALHQDPVVVGGQEVDEEQHGHLAADLITKHQHLPFLITHLFELALVQLLSLPDETLWSQAVHTAWHHRFPLWEQVMSYILWNLAE